MKKQKISSLKLDKAYKDFSNIEIDNRIKKSILISLGAISEVFNLISPLLLVILWVVEFGETGFGSILILVVGIATTFYRSIRNLIRW